MNIKIFCRCNLFPSWSGQGLISTPLFMTVVITLRRHYSDNVLVFCMSCSQRCGIWHYACVQVISCYLSDRLLSYSYRAYSYT